MDSTIDTTTLGVLEQQIETLGGKILLLLLLISNNSILWVINSRKSVLCVPYGFVLPTHSFFNLSSS